MIFYFSGTGNTKWAATVLAGRTEDRLTDISRISGEGFRYTPKAGERIGFCFPVHGWRPPLIFRRFVNSLVIDNVCGHYCYAVCTAGDTVGEAVDILENDLKAVGVHVDSSFSLIMPESYVGLPFMDVDTPGKEKQKKDKAAADLEHFSALIAERKKGIKEITTGRWPRINSRLIGGFFTKYMITDNPFHVTSDKCIGCGRCADACPVDNVLWHKGSAPEWKHDGTCLACFSCYHHCPVHAVEYGRQTRKKGQYYFSEK